MGELLDYLTELNQRTTTMDKNISFVYSTERNSELDLYLAEEFGITIDELDTIDIEIVEKMRVWMNDKMTGEE